MIAISFYTVDINYDENSFFRRMSIIQLVHFRVKNRLNSYIVTSFVINTQISTQHTYIKAKGRRNIKL